MSPCKSLHQRAWRIGAAIALSCALLAGCSGSSGNAGAELSPSGAAATTDPARTAPATEPGAPAAPAAQATVFGSATPPNAPTQQMTLYHVDVPPGAVIAPHQHPGQQISHVTAGTLTYTVIAGTVTVVDAPVNGQPGAAQQVTAPATIAVTAGQTLTEPEGEIHSATNTGPDVVKIDIATLVPQGDPLSVPAA